MFGVPGETIETALSTIELNIRCRTHTNTFSFFAPFPGTKLGELAREYGFSGDLSEIPSEFQEGLCGSIQFENKELIERIGQCAHLFVSYPKLFWFSKKLLKWLPTYKLKLMYMDWLIQIKNELLKRGKRGLPSIWHPPEFIIKAIHGEQPTFPSKESRGSEPGKPREFLF